MAYNPNILRDVLQARSLSRSQLSDQLGLRLADLERELKKEPEPNQSLLNEIAKKLALPPFVFYMEKAPKLNDAIPDFRSETPSIKAKSRETIESIQFAEGIQKAAVALEVGAVQPLPYFSPSQVGSIETRSLSAREYFNITLQDQLQAKNASAFYTVCRKKIEDKGIFVLHDSFPETDGSGFCLYHPTHPVIVINTKKQTRGRRLFTLIHELAHVLMRQTGISDPFVSRNSVERTCNRFAAAFLVPEPYVTELLGSRNPPKTPSLDDVAWLSRRFKISQEASILRVERLGLTELGTYERWKRLTHNNNPDFSTKGGGGGKAPPDQEKVKLAKYGFHFAAVFGPTLDFGGITELNLYRSSGLKPKYQRAYFDYANSLSSNELNDLELEDE